MGGNYSDAAIKLIDGSTDFSSRDADIDKFDAAPAEQVANPEPTEQTVPGPDLVRALLVLTAETAFELRDGVKDSMFLAQLREQTKFLEHCLAVLPDIYQGVDCGLMLRRARQSVVRLDDTIRCEILDQVHENMSMDLVEEKLQLVKAEAVEAGRALVLLSVRCA